MPGAASPESRIRARWAGKSGQRVGFELPPSRPVQGPSARSKPAARPASMATNTNRALDRKRSLPRPRQARQARDHADQADGDPARPVAGLFAGRRRAGACAIAEDPDAAYDYTAKGNLVAVISNGTADPRPRQPRRAGLQAGDGRQGGPVQALRRRRRHRPRGRHRGRRRVRQLRALPGPTFGGINLEDIKAPECFIIEQRLSELMDIPVFHDDQHGTAIIAAAGLINALDI